MLHWLAGAKPPDGGDHDTSAIMEPPETPAPVFAVRAFKHAIFGTPQQTPGYPRRHSTQERERPRAATLGKATRPQLVRPKSAGDATALAKQDDLPEPMPSPTKGILMTPGTAAARRKTVTFGDHVVDNEKDRTKEGSKSGLPNDFPGKFPSPWVQPAEKPDTKDESASSERKRGRSKLTEELHKAREDSAKRKVSEIIDRQSDNKDDDEPDSESGRYWKKEYDVYRANTTREVKKLVTKQKAAKSYARDKDLQCTELSDQLRQEKKKVERLERLTAELEAQVKALEAQIDKEEASAKDTRPAARRSVLVGEDTSTAATSAHLRSRSRDQPSLHTDKEQHNLAESEVHKSRTRRPSPDVQADGAAARTRTRHQPGNLPSDLWSHSLTSPVAASPGRTDPSSNGARNGRTVTSGTGLTPLKSLSINSQQKDRHATKEESRRSRAIERPITSMPDDAASGDAKDNERCDSLDAVAGGLPKLNGEIKRSTPTEKFTSHTSPLLPPSPFDPDGKAHPSSTTTSNKPLPPRPGATGKTDSKENVSPSRAPDTMLGNSKDALGLLHGPRALPAAGPGREKLKKQLSEDRFAAAQARIAARRPTAS
ncbi:hypothetical protein Q7P37_005062 [Cladosporium fusiforme]